jgi:hypothetical protein
MQVRLIPGRDLLFEVSNLLLGLKALRRKRSASSAPPPGNGRWQLARRTRSGIPCADSRIVDDAAATVARIELEIRERFPKITRICIESRKALISRPPQAEADSPERQLPLRSGEGIS